MWCLKKIPQDLKRLEELLESGHEPAIPEQVYEEFYEPYFLTADALSLLEKYGFDYGHTDSCGRNLLHYLTEMDMIPEIRKVLKKIPIDLRDNDRETPLHYALWERSAKGPQYLIQHGANVNCKERHGASALHIVACKNIRYYNGDRYYRPVDLIKLLLQYHAEQESRDKEGMTPLLYAAINSYCRNLRKLIECGANVNAKSKHGKTALHILMDAYPENDTLKCIDLLLAEGVAVNARDCRGNTALHTPFLEYWKKVEGEREKKQMRAICR